MNIIETRCKGAVRFSMASSTSVHHQLIIFPHAGGSVNFYRAWREYLPPGVDLIVIQYPQYTELYDDWNDPINAIKYCTLSLSSLLGISPIIMFGHSMGAIIALHVACALKTSRFYVEEIIISSQCPPTKLQKLLQTENHVDDLKRRILRLDEISRMNELDSVTKGYFEKIIKRDLLLIKKLSMFSVGELPVTKIFGGENDPLVSEVDLNEWFNFLSKSISVEIFPGGHFYFYDKLQSVINTIFQQDLSNRYSINN